PGRILYRFVTETGWLEQLTRGQQEGEIAIQNLARFFEIIKNFETLYPGAQLPQFVRHLDLLIEAGDSPAVVEADAGTEAVEVLTVHKSKGLEFPAVFLVGLSEGRFPTRERVAALEFPTELMRDPEAGSAERHVQEERRLFYVAVTRAKELLWLSSSFDAGQGRAQKVSRFVLEALDRPRVDLAVVRTSSLETLNRFAPQPVAEQGWTKMHPDRMLTLSFRKIDDYLTCPQKYKFVQVLRVPILPHHSVVYGNALHSAVSLCLEGKMKGEMPPLESLEAEFKRAWTGEGFLTLEHEQQRFQAGLTALHKFYAHEQEHDLVPLHVEKDFAFTVGRNKVIGRWDRVDALAGDIILSDYKSAAVANQEQADTRARESLQLSLYALAYRQQEGTLPREVRLIFLETGLVGRSTVDSARLNDALSKIRRAAAGIRARDYTPRPRQRVCSTCAYREICPATTS
ncbi:MAG: ATP-dependent helicase, partial [Candidatus Eremiobacteraeota bacterium]|nr:ATP-dependent helicase [Candidatus Eremiobacteraeota bacterium]